MSFLPTAASAVSPKGRRFVTPVLLAFASLCLVAVGAETTAAAGRSADASIVPHYDKINTARTLLTPDEISAALARLPGWKAREGKLTKTFVRKNFVEAIAFINALVPDCEKIDHHPEIFTVYNKVNLTLTTYDAGQRISSFDVLLAERFEAIAAKPALPAP